MAIKRMNDLVEMKKILNSRGDNLYQHTDLLNMSDKILSEDALKMKAAAAAWLNGEFTEDDIIEAIANNFFSANYTYDFMGRPWDNWDPKEYLEMNDETQIHTEKEMIEDNEYEYESLEIVDQEIALPELDDLKSKEEMETV